MNDNRGQDPMNNANNDQDRINQPVPGDIDKRIDDIVRKVSIGANEAQSRLKRVFNRASDYWQNAQTPPTPRQATSVEEQRIRQLVNNWSVENWRVARDLGTYMDIVSWSNDEVWEVSLETRWETRTMEVSTEPYTGTNPGLPRPLLPVWDYQLPPVTGLKASETRTRLEGLNEVVACTICNGSGHVLCSNCNGRGWIVCPDCKGRTKKRCTTCRGRGYVADWTATGEKPAFLKRTVSNVTNSLGNKVSDVFEGIRQQGVPIPNPVDNDPASKGPTIPCPDCINGELDCTCTNGKRVCSTCQGARMSLCNGCSGTGKLVRHREIVRRFDLRSQTRIVGECPIPEQQLTKANGDLAFSSEINETLHAEAPPERVPIDIWRQTVDLVRSESQLYSKPGIDHQTRPRPTLQVLELVRIPFTKLQYRYGDQEHILYFYDGEGKEKFYADRYPARWDRIERLVKAISDDLVASPQIDEPPASSQASGLQPRPSGGQGYRVHIEVPPHSEDEDQEKPDSPDNW